MSAMMKKRLYLEALGITVYADKHKPGAFDSCISDNVTVANVAPANTKTPNLVAELAEEKQKTLDHATQLAEFDDTFPVDQVISQASSAEKIAEEEQPSNKAENTLTIPLDVALVQNNHGVAVLADVTDFADATNNWRGTEEFLLDIARAATVVLFGDECNVAKAKGQRINGTMSVNGQLKSDQANADFLHGALLGPTNTPPKMIIMLGTNAAFFTEFGEGGELFSQRLQGQSLQQLVSSVEAKQTLWQSLQGYVLHG